MVILAFNQALAVGGEVAASRPFNAPMNSLELVDFINEDRKQQAKEAGAPFPSKEFAKLEHSDFLKKVPLVLGEKVAGNFSCYYKASNGKQNPMYTFPKREACLMAMSYSYEVFPSKGVTKRYPLSTTTEPHEITHAAIDSRHRFNERASAGTSLPAAPR